MPLIALFMIAMISWVIVQAGAKALMMTGLSRSVAEFQAISCFFGVGFTTAEAEIIVNHPVRRRIASHLIVVGNIGLTSAVGALIVTFLDADTDLLSSVFRVDGPVPIFVRLGAAIMGIGLIYFVFRMGIVKAPIEWAVKQSLKSMHAIRPVDYETVLRSHEGYAVVQVQAEQDAWYIGSTLGQTKLGSRGVLVLWIRRQDGTGVDLPMPSTRILEGDLLTVYGQDETVKELMGQNIK